MKYSLNIGGRKVCLLYDMVANDEIEAHDWGFPVGDGENEQPSGFDAMVTAWNTPRRMTETALDLLVILANNAAEVAGQPADLDKTWVKRHIHPGGMKMINEALRMCIRDAMRRTLEDPCEDEEHDVVLEEIEAKKDEAEGSAADGSTALD